MNKYRIRFHGRRKGAIGIFYWITAEREAEDMEGALLALYDEYEHVHEWNIQLITPEVLA